MNAYCSHNYPRSYVRFHDNGTVPLETLKPLPRTPFSSKKLFMSICISFFRNADFVHDFTCYVSMTRVGLEIEKVE